MSEFEIRQDDLRGGEVIALLEQHLAEMNSHTPAESVHALDVDRLRAPGVTFWSVWSPDGRLAGCGALKHLDATHAEIKSMRVADDFRRQGVGQVVLRHLIDAARTAGYRRVSLETGSNPPFEAARHLYERNGFTYCGPFDGYVEDPWSVFMTLEL
ncbi:GNAT family N-acetyltransferase [Aeromicrobium wangtongii]|uniref:GNAT family N-acetyltransferase n=1 Tax=Aeromicrobium wangtongii TaxID=2969247 RepID=UPI002016C1B8|nr:GNAT family N-acetyltransferase [Aeromicrobium wangtongii]MCL3816922.1 GNAT family N-acetyltransferase [Aeromicrobium wangtongii]